MDIAGHIFLHDVGNYKSLGSKRLEFLYSLISQANCLAWS